MTVKKRLQSSLQYLPEREQLEASLQLNLIQKEQDPQITTFTIRTISLMMKHLR